MRGKPMKVLVLDENSDLLESLRRLLTRGGHDAQAVSSATEALEMHRRRPADVLISDIFMPDGLEAMVEFRAKWPALKIVAMSGSDEIPKRNIHELVREIGADALVRKPFEPQTLLDTLRRLARAQD